MSAAVALHSCQKRVPLFIFLPPKLSVGGKLSWTMAKLAYYNFPLVRRQCCFGYSTDKHLENESIVQGKKGRGKKHIWIQHAKPKP